MLVDISDIKKNLNEEEKEIFDKVVKAMNAKSVTVSMLKLAFWVILLYACFAFFLFFLNCCKCIQTRNSIICLPWLAFGI